MNIGLKYIYIYYLLVLKDFMRFVRKRKICFISNLVNLKHLINEKGINIPYWAFSSLLIVDYFQVP